MAIDGGMRGKLPPGTRLAGSYKSVEYQAQVIKGDDGKVRYRLEDGREFKSPSAAGAAVMDGIACNGWRFWSVAAPPAPKRKAPTKRPPAARSTR